MLYKESAKILPRRNLVVCGLFLVVVFQSFQICVATVYHYGLDRSGTNVCEDHRTRSKSYSFRITVVSYNRYTTSCGLFGWARCDRSRSVTSYRYRRGYYSVTDVYLRCCGGWARSGRSCTRAVCRYGCSNGGTCYRPNVCNCRSGWTGSTCRTDINECGSSNGGCQQTCVNTKGSYACSCKYGYQTSTHSSKRCVDVNECYTRRACSCSTSATNYTCEARCRNYNGGFSCSCSRGYHLHHGTVCRDTNECVNYNGGCSHRCLNYPGSYRCECPRGLRLDSQRKSCKDVNECDSNNGNCQHTCRNLFGSHRCSCREGFKSDSNKRTCSDIDECKFGEDECEDYCSNTIGGYVCSCSKGYELAIDKRTCTDVDECSPRNVSGTVLTLSDCHHNCSNVEGSFHCTCRVGYRLMYDKKRCEDIDECVNGEHYCEHSCHNTDGSYRCSCRAGFILAPDGKLCKALPCEEVLPPRHGGMACSGLVTDASCTFSCNPGYDLVGSQSRTCLPSSQWSGNSTLCKEKHCPALRTTKNQTISVPCFTSFGSTCYFGCRPGFFMQGDRRANCSLDSEGDKVSWKIGQFSCEEIKTCHPNPCLHVGKCLVLDKESFACNCTGTGYTGSLCQTGVVSAPIFPKQHINTSSGTLRLQARPSIRLQVSLQAVKGVTFEPPSVGIEFPAIEGEFAVKAEKTGIYAVTYILDGESKDDFQTPQKSVVLVTPEVFDHDGFNISQQLPKQELPIGCEEHRTKQKLSCEIRLLSTAPWSGTPGRTSGIVHFVTPNNHSVPLSLVGLNLGYLNISRHNFIDAVISQTFSKSEFTIVHQRRGTCQSGVANTENLLELMQNDVLTLSFMRAFSEIAPSWLRLAVSESNSAFDIENIAANLAADLEHCSVFPYNQKSMQAFYRPVVSYKVRVAQQEVALFADGTTCFVINVCQPAVFITFPEGQANRLTTSFNVFRNMAAIGLHLKVNSIGLLGRKETLRFVEGTVWNGRKLKELRPFTYNMWIKGSLEWRMQIPEVASVMLKVTGMVLVKSRNIDTLFVDGISQPVETQVNGKAFLSLTGRALGKDFVMKLDSVVIRGNAILGEKTLCSDTVQGIFLTSEEPVIDLLNNSPFSRYIHPREAEPLHLAILMSLRGGKVHEVHRVETRLQGISLHLRTNLCVGQLCFKDLSTIVDTGADLERCYSKQSFPSTFRARGKVLKTMPLSSGNILTLAKDQIVNMVFPRESNLVSADFSANVHLFGVSQLSNVTLFKEQLSFELKGQIFNKHMANMMVVADTNHVAEWSSLLFIVNGRIEHSSQLSKSLQEKVTDFADYLARKALKNVQNVENSLQRAKQRVYLTRRIVKEKEQRLERALELKQRKYLRFQQINSAYGKAKISLNSSLVRFFKIKNKQMCEYQVCHYVDTNACIPTVCQKANIINYKVPNCKTIRKTDVVYEIVPKEYEEIEEIQTYVVKRYSDCTGTKAILGAALTVVGEIASQSGHHLVGGELKKRGSDSMESTTNTLVSIGDVLTAAGDVATFVGAPVIGGILKLLSTGFKVLGALSDALFGCDYYDEKVKGPIIKKTHKVIRNERVKKEVSRVEYDCEWQQNSVVSGYAQPYECCKNNVVSANIQVLDAKCVSHNLACSNNMTKLREEIKSENISLSLSQTFHAIAKAGKQAILAQLELTKAQANVDVAANQLEIANATLMQHKHAYESINIQTVRSREKLGLKLGEKLKSAKGKPLILVNRLEFSVSMTKSSTKTRFPLTAYFKTLEGTNKSFKFSMDFSNENHSLTLTSTLIVKELYGASRTRGRRSLREVFTASKQEKQNTSGLSLGQLECLHSQEANSFFSDIIESVEFVIRSRNELEGVMAVGLRGLEKLPVNEVLLSEPSSQEIQAALNDTAQSLKQTYLNEARPASWNSTLTDLRAFLDLMSKEKKFTTCSGIQDCVDFFFDSLADMYEFEYHQRAIEIKGALKELEKTIGKILNENHTMFSLESMITQAKILIINTKDDLILCSKKPIMAKNSPTEVVTTIGKDIQLECEATSTIAMAYLWFKEGEPLEGTNGTRLELKNITNEREGAYWCQASNSRGKTVSNVTIVKVHQTPHITQQPLDARVLVGEEIISMICNSTGVPRPLTEWFFIPIKGATNGAVRVNTTKTVLEMHNLKSDNAGFYYCNVSNLHGTVQSRMAKLDVLSFSAGVPRIAVKLGLKWCPRAGFPENERLPQNKSSKPSQQLDLTAFDYVSKKLLQFMNWTTEFIESRHYSPFPDASILLVVKGADSSVSDEEFPAKQLEAALNSFSLSKKRMGSSLMKLYSALEDENLGLEWKNRTICVDKDIFTIGFPPQRCPIGTRHHSNGFLCVNCAPGYYGVTNGTCLPCPSGSYQPGEGKTECINCPFRRSSTEPGAFRETHCVDITIPCKPPNETEKNVQALNEMKTLYRTGETIELDCKIGYKGIGNGTQECIEGNWTTTEFHCQKTCLPPWKELKKRCYKVVESPAHRWRDASAMCWSLQSHMVTIYSEEENDFAAELVKAHMKKNNFTKVQMWLGLSKPHAKAEFQWVDGSPLANYSNWSPGEPNGILGSELCTEMLVFGSYWLKRWNDVRCDTTSYKPVTVCEKPMRN